MSAGHPHKRPNERHETELAKKLADPDVRRMLARRYRVDLDHDVPDLAGYNGMGSVYFLDRHFAAAIRAGEVMIDGRPASLVQLVRPLIGTPGRPGHERIEKCLLDAIAPPQLYPDAHEFATCGEHEIVRRELRWRPFAYEAGLRKFIKRSAAERIEHPPLDLDCAPLLDDPDRNDKRVLAILRQLGVAGASKLSRATVRYGIAKPAANCGRCRHYRGDALGGLCDIVEGFQRPPLGCDRFKQGATRGRQDPAVSPRPSSSGPAAGSAERRQAGGGEAPARPGGRPARAVRTARRA